MVSYIRPITRSQALRQGYTDKDLRGPRFQRLFQGVYLPSGVRVTLLHRALAALLVAPPGAYVSHHTAAALWGGVVPDTEDTHISVPGEATRSIRRGLFAHRADSAFLPVHHRGVAVAPALATFLQLASLRLDLVALVVLGDSLVRRKRVTPERLVEAAAQWNGKGARLARRAASLVRQGVDSAMETRVRLLIVLAGLPEPQVNFIVRGENGAWELRFDLCYPELKLIVEYDGLWHLRDKAQWRRDIQRREWMDAQGWRIIVVASDDIFIDPAATVRRVRQALVERGCQGLPSRTPAAWNRQFMKVAA